MMHHNQCLSDDNLFFAVTFAFWSNVLWLSDKVTFVLIIFVLMLWKLLQLWLKITLLRSQRFFWNNDAFFYKVMFYFLVNLVWSIFFFFYWKKLLWYFNSFQFVGAKEFSLIFNSTGSWGHNFVNLLMWCYESILYMCFNFFFFEDVNFLVLHQIHKNWATPSSNDFMYYIYSMCNILGGNWFFNMLNFLVLSRNPPLNQQKMSDLKF